MSITRDIKHLLHKTGKFVIILQNVWDVRVSDFYLYDFGVYNDLLDG